MGAALFVTSVPPRDGPNNRVERLQEIRPRMPAGDAREALRLVDEMAEAAREPLPA